MSVRGQNPEAWCARWRKGMCPVHGAGLVDDDGAAAPSPEDGVAAHCPREACTVRACRWPGKDDAHSFFGWLAGPDDARQALVRGGDIEADGPRPGSHARSVRTAWRLDEDPEGR